MKYRHLVNSGLEVSEIGLGTNNFGGRMDAGQADSVINAAIDLGINLIDTADIYSHGVSEEYIGRAVGDKTGKRESVLIATKFGMQWDDGPHGVGGSRKRVMDGVEGSLRRLQTDYIDLFQFHRPDPNTPISETLQAMDDLVRDGKVRYIGNSNFAAWQIADASWVATTEHLTQFVSAQPEYSMLVRNIESEIVPACHRYGLGILPFFPLAMGVLTGKYKRGADIPDGTRLAGMPAERRDGRLTDSNFGVIEQLEPWARDRGHSLLELAFAWLLATPEVSSVIAGASNPEQLAQNARACEWVLSSEEKAEVDGMLGG